MTEKKKGISFYGLSKEGIKCYQEEIPGYHKWTLPTDIVEDIVDLHLPDNKIKIKEMQETHPIFKRTLLFINNKNNRNQVCRKSDKSEDDREMALLLKKAFPGKKGSYTQKTNIFIHKLLFGIPI